MNLRSVATSVKVEDILRKNAGNIKRRGEHIILFHLLAESRILKKLKIVFKCQYSNCWRKENWNWHRVCWSSNCQHYWHNVFGQRDIDGIGEIGKRDLTNGIHIQECLIRKVFEVCFKCKMIQKPFNKQSDKNNKIIGPFYADVCSPMQTVTPGGKRYFVIVRRSHPIYVTLRKISLLILNYKIFKFSTNPFKICKLVNNN